MIGTNGLTLRYSEAREGGRDTRVPPAEKRANHEHTRTYIYIYTHESFTQRSLPLDLAISPR